MGTRRSKPPRDKDLTTRYLADDMDEDKADARQRFTARSKATREHGKVHETALLRAAAEEISGDLAALPVGDVVQVHSLFYTVAHQGTAYLCVMRKTLSKLSSTGIVVGDRVRFRAVMVSPEKPPAKPGDSSSGPEEGGVIEQILPRETLLTRADSFKGVAQHAIVANAQQMLIVVSLRQPGVKWGLVDRMIVAAQGGKLVPIVCLNKIDLGTAADKDVVLAREALAQYRTLNVVTIETSVEGGTGLDELRAMLRDRETVLAGHSGVGKSSLIRAIQPALDIRIGDISHYTDKGRHTTTSARRYPLDFGGAVIDTPGVKLFGLWGVTRENLIEFFPDVAAEAAAPWRRESYERILQSLSA